MQGTVLIQDGVSKRRRYGLLFPVSWNSFDIELHCFKIGRTVDQGGLGKAEHFWRATDFCWGPSNPVKNTSKYFIRNPWGEDMIEEFCSHKYVAVGGATGTTKSETAAMWLLMNYLAKARGYLGVILSTSLKEARKRIWGSLTDFIKAVPDGLLPLKIVDSMGIIRYNSATFKAGDRASLSLIASERKQEKEAIGKLIGMHQDEVCVVADELTELPESILEYALPGGNLTSNPKYQMIGLSNPASYFDSFAKLWKPKDGWTSITVDSTRWETQYGVGLHFDALKSPNVPVIKYTTPKGKAFLPTAEQINSAMEAEGGANALRFWRMWRGFMCPIGEEDLIYTDGDIIKYKGDEPAIWGDQPVIQVAAVDPAFTNGGDRPIIYFGTLGRDKSGQLVLQFDHFEKLTIDATSKDPVSYQIARQIKEKCEAKKIPPSHVAIDSTGAGTPFCDIVSVTWSPEILRVNFGGNASDSPVSLTDLTPAKEKYHDRVSEIWYSGKELLRQGQLKGIPPDLMAEMTARKYGITGIKKRVYVESKADMKLRTLKSPDIADAAFILVTLCRERFGLTMIVAKDKPIPNTVSWRQFRAMRSPKLNRPNNLGTRRLPISGYG